MFPLYLPWDSSNSFCLPDPSLWAGRCTKLHPSLFGDWTCSCDCQVWREITFDKGDKGWRKGKKQDQIEKTIAVDPNMRDLIYGVDSDKKTQNKFKYSTHGLLNLYIYQLVNSFICWFVNRTISRVYAITVVLTILFTRMMTLANILVLKNNIDVMREVFIVLRGRGKDFFAEVWRSI